MMPATRCAVVVLPLVPVTPVTTSSRDGSPYQRAAISASARRADGTMTCVIAGSATCSHTSAPAPAAAARAANSCPSARSPGTQKKSVPSPTSRVW